MEPARRYFVTGNGSDTVQTGPPLVPRLSWAAEIRGVDLWFAWSTLGFGSDVLPTAYTP